MNVPGLMHEDITDAVIGAAIEVHKSLGPGLLESAYESCLYHELASRGVCVERQKTVAVKYKDQMIDCGYRLDLLVDHTVIVEIKAVEKLLPIREAQLLTYMKLADMRVGLLINFNVTRVRDGIIRRVL